jgi:uncharacterized protein (TIGR00661 family)
MNWFVFLKKWKNLESEPIFPDNIKKILVCPLNWGLGHASRLIPVIQELVQNKFEVYIAAAGYSSELLRQEFPGLEFIKFPSFTITYGKDKPLSLQIFVQLPKIIYEIIKEHVALKKLVKNYSIDLVISDNRFGLWSKRAAAVYITHQVRIILPAYLKFIEPLIYRLNKLIISKYDECWIPDFADPFNNLSGALSHMNKLPANIKFIGPLSRFNMYPANSRRTVKYRYDLIIILSGPEPQRSVIEKQLVSEIHNSDYKVLIVRGKPGIKQITRTFENITLASHFSTAEFLNMINRSKYIICRSGYSTIMDLVTLKRTAILIPTPGQTEQEYLARHLSKYFYCIEQNNFSLKKAIEEIKKYNPLSYDTPDSQLKKNIQNLKSLKKQAEKRNYKKSQSESCINLGGFMRSKN